MLPEDVPLPFLPRPPRGPSAAARGREGGRVLSLQDQAGGQEGVQAVRDNLRKGEHFSAFFNVLLNFTDCEYLFEGILKRQTRQLLIEKSFNCDLYFPVLLLRVQAV